MIQSARLVTRVNAGTFWQGSKIEENHNARSNEQQSMPTLTKAQENSIMNSKKFYMSQTRFASKERLNVTHYNFN